MAALKPGRERRRSSTRATFVAWAGVLVLLPLALSACATRGSLIAKGMADARNTEQALLDTLQPRRVALVIGVDSYQDPMIPPLFASSRDAEDFGRVLRGEDHSGFDRVEILRSPALTTRDQLLEQLRAVTAELRKQDVFVLYFSGHGTVQQQAPGLAELYLLPSDANASDIAGSAIELRALRSWFSDLPSQRKALIIDACFNGLGKSAVNPDVLSRIDEVLADVQAMRPYRLGSGEAHLYATTLGLPAFEDKELGHGVYTHFLLQALSWGRLDADSDGDGLITAYEAHDYARRRTLEHTGGAQVPEASIRMVGMADVVLVGDPKAQRERDQALVFDYSSSSSLAGARLFLSGREKGVFPGTVAVPAGRQLVELRDARGALLLGGWADFTAGSTLRAGELKKMVREQRVLAALRIGGVAGPRSSWGPLWGDGYGSVEGWLALRRARGPMKGLLIGATLGAGLLPRRFDGEGVVRKDRGDLWLGLDAGWAGNKGRLLGRLSWQSRVTVLPQTSPTGEGLALSPTQAGWIVLSMGPSAGIGFRIDRRLGVVFSGSLQGTFFATDSDPRVRPHVFGAGSIGLELAL